MELSALAHNVLIWAQEWLGIEQPKLKHYGLKRWVRDVLAISGMIGFKAQGMISQISLNEADRFAHLLVESLATLLVTEQVCVNLIQT